MAIRSLVLEITYSYPAVTSDGRKYKGSRCVRIMLPGGDLQSFLTSLPDDIDEYSMAWLTVERPDGKLISFVDGVQPSSQGEGWGPLVRLGDMDKEYTDAVRAQASRWARHDLDSARGVSRPPGEQTGAGWADAEIKDASEPAGE